MPETAMVTICYEGQQSDFELPLKLTISTWLSALAKALKQSFYGIKLQNREIMLFSHDRYLSPDLSLLEFGIYDGSVLELRLK